MNIYEAEQFERKTIVAALFRLCDPSRTMEQIKLGDTVQLKSGGPVMTVGEQPVGFRGHTCHWFDGKELRQGVFRVEQLKPAEPRQEEPQQGSAGIQTY
jgi:uncharacterized protein YodC (DUF2158 family)